MLSNERRAELELAARDVIKIETATEPRFQELFVAAMAFPHATRAEAAPGGVVELPGASPAADATRRAPAARSDG